MQKHKGDKKSAESQVPLTVGGEAARAEIGALVCDVLLLGMFLYDQIFHGLNMWFVILPLFAIGLYLVFFGIIPEEYRFTGTSLEIRHIFCKTVCIPYETVFNFEAKERDNFAGLLQENKVKVYHTAGKTKKLTVCRPRDVYTFTSELKKRCPEFGGEEQNSNLEIFFK